jgi:cyclopropane fatty-acyl-phospholipid synthase-like methyltransferase
MVLERAVPEHGTVLEIASGTGQHVVKFAAALPGLTWRPSDIDPAALEAIVSRVREAALDNIEPPRYLDVENPSSWPLDNVDAVLCINMMHISDGGAFQRRRPGPARRRRARKLWALQARWPSHGA